MNLSRTIGAFGAALLLAAAGNMPEREQRRLARNFVGGHGRGTRRYSWLPKIAFNEYRPSEGVRVATLTGRILTHATADAEDARVWRQNRNAAKRARRERAHAHG